MGRRAREERREEREDKVAKQVKVKRKNNLKAAGILVLIAIIVGYTGYVFVNSDSNVPGLFRSHREDYKDGEQERDFIYVKDVVDICFFLMNHRKDSGLYNVGTGKARTFYDLADLTFKAMGKESKIGFIDTPVDIRDKYQYFTEADMNKLRSIGFNQEFTSLEDGIKDYVQNYLSSGEYY